MKNSWAYSLPTKYPEISGNRLYSLRTTNQKSSLESTGSRFISATTERENSSIHSDVYRDLTSLTICINIRPLGYIMTFNCKITLVRFVDIIALCIVVIVVIGLNMTSIVNMFGIEILS